MSVIITFGWRGFGYDRPPVRELRLGWIGIAVTRRPLVQEVASLKLALHGSRDLIRTLLDSRKPRA